MINLMIILWYCSIVSVNWVLYNVDQASDFYIKTFSLHTVTLL